MVSAVVAGTNSYGSLADALTYLDDSPSGAAFLSFDADSQARFLITATRLIERQCLLGVPTDPMQDLHFPATGLTDQYGNAIDSATIPIAVQQAEFELASALSQDPDLELVDTTGSNIRVVKAGSASVEYFRPGGVGGPASSTRFPPAVQDLIGPFLCGARGGSNGFASGTNECTTFDNAHQFNVRPALS